MKKIKKYYQKFKDINYFNITKIFRFENVLINDLTIFNQWKYDVFPEENKYFTNLNNIKEYAYNLMSNGVYIPLLIFPTNDRLKYYVRSGTYELNAFSNIIEPNNQYKLPCIILPIDKDLHHVFLNKILHEYDKDIDIELVLPNVDDEAIQKMATKLQNHMELDEENNLLIFHLNNLNDIYAVFQLSVNYLYSNYHMLIEEGVEPMFRVEK